MSKNRNRCWVSLLRRVSSSVRTKPNDELSDTKVGVRGGVERGGGLGLTLSHAWAYPLAGGSSGWREGKLCWPHLTAHDYSMSNTITQTLFRG